MQFLKLLLVLLLVFTAITTVLHAQVSEQSDIDPCTIRDGATNCVIKNFTLIGILSVILTIIVVILSDRPRQNYTGKSKWTGEVFYEYVKVSRVKKTAHVIAMLIPTVVVVAAFGLVLTWLTAFAFYDTTSAYSIDPLPFYVYAIPFIIVIVFNAIYATTRNLWAVYGVFFVLLFLGTIII